MSEVSKLTKLIGDLQQWNSTRIDQQLSYSSQEYVTRFNNVNIACTSLEKIIAKSKVIDPLTNLPRYGEKTCSKIAQLNEDARSLSLLFEKLADEMKEEESKILDIPLSMNICADPEPLVIQSLIPAETSIPSDAAAINNDTISNDAKNRQLALQAEMSRQKRHADKLELQDILNQVNTLSPQTTDSFVSAYMKLEQESRNLVSKILSNVLSNPSDDKLRRIKFNHPVILANLTKITAGIEVIVSIGFKAHSEPEPDLETFSTSAQGQQIRDTLPLKILQLSNNTNSRVVFYLSEPSVDESIIWIEWFDYLQKLREVIG